MVIKAGNANEEILRTLKLLNIKPIKKNFTEGGKRYEDKKKSILMWACVDVEHETSNCVLQYGGLLGLAIAYSKFRADKNPSSRGELVNQVYLEMRKDGMVL